MWLWKILRHKFLLFIWICSVVLPAAGLNWLKEHSELVPSLLMSVMIAAYLFFCAASFYICMDTALHMDEDLGLSFWEALKRSYGDFKMLLSFVPIIGPLFEPDEDKTHYDPDEE